MEESASRRKVIIAAMELTVGRRLAEIGTDELARHSRIDAQEVEALFPDHQALLNAIFLWAADNLMLQVEQAALCDKPPLEVLEEIFRIQVSFLVVHPSLPALLLEALVETGRDTVLLRRRIAKLLQDYDATLAMLFHLARRGNQLRGDLEPTVAVTLFSYLTQALVMRTLIGDTASDNLKQEGRKIWQQYLEAIRA